MDNKIEVVKTNKPTCTSISIKMLCVRSRSPNARMMGSINDQRHNGLIIFKTFVILFISHFEYHEKERRTNLERGKITENKRNEKKRTIDLKSPLWSNFFIPEAIEYVFLIIRNFFVVIRGKKYPISRRKKDITSKKWISGVFREYFIDSEIRLFSVIFLILFNVSQHGHNR